MNSSVTSLMAHVVYTCNGRCYRETQWHATLLNHSLPTHRHFYFAQDWIVGSSR